MRAYEVAERRARGAAAPQRRPLHHPPARRRHDHRRARLDTASSSRRCCTTWSRTPASRSSDIEREFGDEIASLVDGVTKLGKINFGDGGPQAENFRKMVVAMARDIRVLAHQALRPPRQHAHARAHEARGAGAHRARDARDLRAARQPPRHPLAQERARGPLVPTLEPDALRRGRAAASPSERRRATSTSPRSRRRSRAASPSRASPPTSPGRPKHLYSIWRKMNGERRDFDQIYDIIAFRVLVESVTRLLRRARRHPLAVDAGPGPLQGLHRAAQAEHVPVAAHDGHRPGARAHRDPDPHARDAPRRRARHRRALEVQGEAQRRHRPRTRSASAGCAS